MENFSVFAKLHPRLFELLRIRTREEEQQFMSARVVEVLQREMKAKWAVTRLICIVQLFLLSILFLVSEKKHSVGITSPAPIFEVLSERAQRARELDEVLVLIDEANDRLVAHWPEIGRVRKQFKAFVEQKVTQSTTREGRFDEAQLTAQAKKLREQFKDQGFRSIYEYANFLADLVLQLQLLIDE